MTAVATKSGRPFTLPKKPIDRYEVTYFYVGGYGEDPYIRHVRCVYHENSTWAFAREGGRGRFRNSVANLHRRSVRRTHR